MIAYTLYMSTKEPQVIFEEKNNNDMVSSVKYEDDSIILNMGKTSYKDIYMVCKINMLKSTDDYIKAIWDKESSSLSWDRTVDTYTLPSVENDDEGDPIIVEVKNFFPSITINYNHPSHKYTPNPYWISTLLEARNPDKIIAHYPFILSHNTSDSQVNPNDSLDSLLSGYNDLFKTASDSDITNSDYGDLIDIKRGIEELINKIPNVDAGIDSQNKDNFIDYLNSFISQTSEKIGIYNNISLLSEDLIRFLNGAKNDWIVKVPDESSIHYEKQPIVRPGEYINLRWEFYVDNKHEMSSIAMIPYETPLFTGGKIISKQGESVNLRYNVQVFGIDYYNIIPTDFFDYKIGKWCYLMKIAPLSGEHQEFGSGDITSGESRDLLNLLNQVRIDNGKEILISNDFLNQAAQQYAQTIFETDYFSHITESGQTPHDRISDAGYYVELPINATGLDSENLTYFTSNFIINIDGSTEIDIMTNHEKAVQNWIDSAEHFANLIDEQWIETGVGFYTAEDSDQKDDDIDDIVNQKKENTIIYYVQVFAFRTDGINVGIESKYRLTPFNFKGPMSDDMAIDYRNDLEIDSAINFEKVFDMIQYEGIIESVDTDKDTATVKILSISETETFNIPITYHCNGEPIMTGGSEAFSVGDTCIIKRLKETEDEADFDNAFIIGFPDKLKSCSLPIYLIHFNIRTQIYEQVNPFSDDIVSIEYNDQLSVETSDDYPILYLTYDNLTIKLAVHGSDIFMGDHDFFGKGWATKRNSITCLYKGEILDFDKPNNDRFQRKETEIELFDEINKTRLENSRSSLIDNISLNLAANIYNTEMYDYDDRIAYSGIFIPEIPSTSLTLLQQMTKTGYLQGLDDYAETGYYEINYDGVITASEFVNKIMTEEEYALDKLKLLEATAREIGIGIFDGKIRIIMAYKTIAENNSTNAVIDYGINVLSSKWSAKPVCDINSININDKNVTVCAFVGYSSKATVDDELSVSVFVYVLNTDRVPFMEQYSFNLLDVDGDIIGCKIIDSESEDYDFEIEVYHQYIYNDTEGVSKKDIKKFLVYGDIEEDIETIDAEYLYYNATNYIIWNYLLRYYEVLPKEANTMGIITIDGSAYFQEATYPDDPEEGIYNNVSELKVYDAEGDFVGDTEADKYIPKKNSFLDIEIIEPEYFHLQSILLHSVGSSIPIMIVYSKHKTESISNWWEMPENLDGDFETYIMTSEGVVIDIEGDWSESFFAYSII